MVWKRKSHVIIHDNGNRMQIVTCNLPKAYLKMIEILIHQEDGIYPSRSELIRCAVRDFLHKELSLKEDVKEKIL